MARVKHSDAKKSQKAQEEALLAQAKRTLQAALVELRHSLFSPLLEYVIIQHTPTGDGPRWAYTDTVSGGVWLNPHGKQILFAEEWSYILAHQLLHLCFRHSARREGRDPLLWSVACDMACDSFLLELKIGKPPLMLSGDSGYADMTEEEIYDELKASKLAPDDLRSFAGAGRPSFGDVAKALGPLTWSGWGTRRTDWETLLAEGIRQAVEGAVSKAAEALGQAAEEKSTEWRQAREARRWVMNELPLLGALSAQIKVITDSELCERMDIPVAAVNAYLGEMYLRSDRNMTPEEIKFVYVHELLHVALLHHTRTAHRDPHVWNLACDFVINGWLLEMNIGKMPAFGGLFDPRLHQMTSEEVYDLLMMDRKRLKGLRGFRGNLGDVLLDTPRQRIHRDDVSTLDDVYRRCLSAGMLCPQRGVIPAGLLEEIQSLFAPPVPWDVELARWMDSHIPLPREWRRSYARASRRQASTPDIPRAATFLPQEVQDAHTFGVVLDTSGSMDRQLLGRALGAIASFAESRDVSAIRVVLCDATPYDKGYLEPVALRQTMTVQGRGGTVLQKGISFLTSRDDFPASAPIMVLTDGWCEEEILCAHEHCFVLPRPHQADSGGRLPTLRTSAPIFRVLKEAHEED